MIKLAVGIVLGVIGKHYYTKWKIKKLIKVLNDPLDAGVETFFDVFKKLGIKFGKEE